MIEAHYPVDEKLAHSKLQLFKDATPMSSEQIEKYVLPNVWHTWSCFL